MKPFVTFVAAASLMLGTIALSGCSSSDWQRSGSEGTTAGGNGAFGESTAQPGSYQGEQPHNNAPNAPATQPANGYD